MINAETILRKLWTAIGKDADIGSYYPDYDTHYISFRTENTFTLTKKELEFLFDLDNEDKKEPYDR